MFEMPEVYITVGHVVDGSLERASDVVTVRRVEYLYS